MFLKYRDSDFKIELITFFYGLYVQVNFLYSLYLMEKNCIFYYKLIFIICTKNIFLNLLLSVYIIYFHPNK